jgi:Kef-type K+ transport system membrane component KefB
VNGVVTADPVTRFLLAVAVVVFVSHLVGVLVGWLGQPPIIGEIVGGLVLGPSVLGLVWGSGRAWIFPPEVVKALDLAAQLGLVTFMFLVGSELRLNTLRTRRAAVASVSVAATGLPFVAGLGVAFLGRDLIAGEASDGAAYLVFLGLACSVTALPVLARILVDLKMDGSPVATLAMACAAAGDAVVWCALTVVLGALTLPGTHHALVTAGLAAALLLAGVLALRPALAAFVRRVERTSPAPERVLLPALVGGALAFAAATQAIGLHPVIGAFLFGTFVPRGCVSVEHVGRQLRGFPLAILLPLFFAGIGLRTSVGLLGTSAANWLLFAGMLVVAIGTKFVGAHGGARLAGVPGPEAVRLGVLMNCRGVTELVVATIGWQFHLINDLGLTILVLVALITTGVTAPVMRALDPVPKPVPQLESGGRR